MIRYQTWVANTLLFALCCFLVADTANAIIAVWLTPEASASIAPRAQNGSVPRSLKDLQVIMERNVFYSPPLLRLVGTIFSENRELAWASIQDESDSTSTAIALAVGDEIQGVTVLSIERQRIVLDEKGVSRALTLDEETPPDSVRAASTKLWWTRGPSSEWQHYDHSFGHLRTYVR